MSHANLSVFVPHIGCPNRCSFCDQHTISGSRCAPTPQRVQQLCTQAMQQRSGQLSNTQLAFFGGSFTAIEREYMLSLLQAAQPFLGKDGFAGIRISTRPDAVDEPMLDCLQQYGVNAIELGAQSMSDRVLECNGRGHTAEQVADASRRIRARGIELGLQMMTGLYGAARQDDIDTAYLLAQLQPSTVRIYPTITLQGTMLERLYRAGEYQPMQLEEAVEECSELLYFFENQGIRVIRMGLHAQESLEQGYVAGPYHPAFRELCEGRLYLQQALRQIQRFPEGTALRVCVAPNALSKMAGQHRCNLQRMQQRNPVKIRARSGLQPFEVLVMTEQRWQEEMN